VTAISNLDDFRALDPFFRIIKEGLTGLADGDHFFDLLADDVVFDYVITVPNYPRQIVGRTAVAELYRPYGETIMLHRCFDLAIHHDCQTGVVVLEYASEGRVVATGADYSNVSCARRSSSALNAFGHAEMLVGGVVHDDVEPAGIADDALGGQIARVLREHVELKHSQVACRPPAVVGELVRVIGVAPAGVLHRGVHGVPGIGEVPCREPAEAGACAGDDDRAADFLQVPGFDVSARCRARP
jgi:hypothetical protein